MTAVRGEMSGARSSAMALARRAERWGWRTQRTAPAEGSTSDEDAGEGTVSAAGCDVTGRVIRGAAASGVAASKEVVGMLGSSMSDGARS